MSVSANTNLNGEGELYEHRHEFISRTCRKSQSDRLWKNKGKVHQWIGWVKLVSIEIRHRWTELPAVSSDQCIVPHGATGTECRCWRNLAHAYSWYASLSSGLSWSVRFFSSSCTGSIRWQKTTRRILSADANSSASPFSRMNSPKKWRRWKM